MRMAGTFEALERLSGRAWKKRAGDQARWLVQQMREGVLDAEDCSRLRGMSLDNFAVRDALCHYIFFLATRQWMDSIERLVQGKRVVEICAGQGVVAQAMKARGLDWVATDKDPPARSHVRKMTAIQAVSRLKPEIIFCSWPPLRDELDKEAADRGIPMIIVGEHRGCTGSDAFFDAHTTLVAVHAIEGFEDICSFHGIKDFTMLVNWPGK